MYDLVIKEGTLVTSGGTFRSDLAVQGEKIASIGKNLKGAVEVDAAGLLVLPGAVDPHVHLEMPTAFTRTSEDWASGSLAAAYGGTTTVIDFVEPEEGQLLTEAFELRRRQALGCSAVDFSLHMTITSTKSEVLSQLSVVIKRGITSFKMYTTYPGFALSDPELLRALEEIREVGGIALVHCENDAIVQDRTAKLITLGKTHPHLHPTSRPVDAEVEAVNKVLAIANYTQTPVYIVHISTRDGSAAIRRAQERGQFVFGETCPQYLLLSDQLMNSNDPLKSASLICAPPLRKPQEAAALWPALSDETLQSVGSDHCAFNIVGQKDAGRQYFPDVPGGLPGIETRLSLIYTFGVCTNRLTLEQWVAYCCTNPAKIFGLWPRKGSLMPGADADLVLFDPKKQVTLTRSLLHEQVDYTPYEGMKCTGYPVATFLRGRQLISEGERIQNEPIGIFLPRQPLRKFPSLL